jgi:hypothetical protein
MKPSELTEAQRQDVLTSIAREVTLEVFGERDPSTHPVISRHQQIVDEAADRGDALRASLEPPE